jgi:hypothetical protein
VLLSDKFPHPPRYPDIAMRPSVIVPLVALLAGFAGGWLAKPAPPAATAPPVAGRSTNPPPSRPPLASDRPEGDLPPPPGGGGPPRGGNSMAGDPTGAGATAESRDAAKMLRFVEVLDLSAAQQTDLEKILAETRAAYTTNNPNQPMTAKETLELVAKCSTALEKSLTGLLTPEQATKFADNRIEAKAHRELGHLSELTDLSASQRDQILAQLREANVAELSAIPASYALMLDSSVLPLGPHAMPEQSILTLTQVAETSDSPEPSAAQAKLIADQRTRLDERLALLKPILTSAQLAQYQAAAAEQQAFHDRMAPPR